MGIVSLLPRLESIGDYVVHVVVPVLREPSPENHVPLIVRKRLVFLAERVVPLVVHRIEALHSVGPFGRVLARDDRDVLFPCGAPALEVLVLDDSCVWHLGLGVVDDGVSLIVLDIDSLGLEAHSPPLKLPEFAFVELVDFSREHDSLGERFPSLSPVKKILACPAFCSVKEGGD